MVLVGLVKSGARPEVVCRSVQNWELWLEGVSLMKGLYISLSSV